LTSAQVDIDGSHVHFKSW